MNDTSINTSSKSPVAVKFPALGPSFISADDAAYWVHRQMAGRRDKAYGGVIVERSDGKFQPTLPVAGRTGFFDFSALLYIGSPTGELLSPVGCSGAAFYLFNPAEHADVLRFHPDWTADQIGLYLGFFSRAHIVSYMQDASSYGQRHYVSGPDGSLIKYQSSDVSADKKLFELAIKPFASFADVERLIQTMVRIGTLSVLVANAQWGGVRGQVPGNWTPGTAVTSRLMTVNVQPFYGPVFDRAYKAIEAVAQTLTTSHDSAGLGFVLKSAGSPDCVATYPTPSSPPQTALLKTFPTTADRKLEPVLDYALDGVYFVSQPDAVQSASEPWLYERFFSTDNLAAGISFSKHDVYRQEYADYLKVYGWIGDGAVLQYRPSVHIKEVPLEDSASLNAQLKAGTLKPMDYVRQVAAAGELTVLKDSALWDVVGIVGPDWEPYAGSRRMSPVFVMADDAARFAHDEIGSRRDQGYVGLILQDRHNRFVATEPVWTATQRFALDRLCPLDASGAPVILTEGYSLHGMYASRWRADSRVVSDADEEERLMLAQMFTDNDIRAVLEKRKHVAAFYLSGSADSLLVYSPDERSVGATKRLQERVAMLADGNTLIARELTAGTLEPGKVVDELARTGRLRVVVGNEVWGPRGTVLGDDVSNEIGSSDVAAPALGAVFSSPEDVVLSARDRARGDYRAAASGLGFILRHKNRNEYVATETVPARHLEVLNQSSDFGAPVLIEEFHTFGLFYSASWMPQRLSTADAWFARHFVPVSDLAAAIYDDKDTQRLTHHQDLSIFIATLDGALLRFKYSSSSTQFDKKGAQELASVLANDTPPYAKVIRLIASAGELEVLRTSELWDEPGVVDADWKPYAQLQRRALSPVFLLQDDAVRYAMAQLGSRRERVYGGLVLRRVDGLFVATLPVAVAVENFPANWIRLDDLAEKGLFLAGSTVVARYHSRVHIEPIFALSSRERDVYLNMFSTNFLSDILPTSVGSQSLSPGKEYLLGLDNSLISYTLSGNAAEKKLAGALAAPSQLQRWHNAIELQMRSGALSPSDYVNQVARAGLLQVVQGSRLWGEAKQVSGWVPYPDVISPELHRFAVADPTLSPVFTQMDDAVRHIHRMEAPRTRLRFGFVLKSLGSERYVTTLPIVGEQGRLSLDRVFPNGLLPLGYDIQGIYLCPSTASGQRAHDFTLSFISPLDLVRGMEAVMVTTAKGFTYRSVYLSCADGALLQYEPTSNAAQWGSFQATVAYEKILQSGRESLVEYLRKVIRHGELRAVVRSTFWSPLKGIAKGALTGGGLVSWPQDNRFALGPIFAHADDAARSAQRLVGEYVGQQSLGGVLVRQATASFVAVEPLADGLDSGAASRLFYSGPGGPIAPVTVPGAPQLPIPVFPQGYKWVAVHQFYKAFNQFVTGLSAADRLLMHHLALADLRFCTNVVSKNGALGGSCYFTGRGGSLFKFTPSFSAQEAAFFDEESNKGLNDFLARLASVGRLEVLDGDGYWRRGIVGTDWKSALQPTVRPVHDEL